MTFAPTRKIDMRVVARPFFEGGNPQVQLLDCSLKVSNNLVNNGRINIRVAMIAYSVTIQVSLLRIGDVGTIIELIWNSVLVLIWGWRRKRTTEIQSGFYNGRSTHRKRRKMNHFHAMLFTNKCQRNRLESLLKGLLALIPQRKPNLDHSLNIRVNSLFHFAKRLKVEFKAEDPISLLVGNNRQRRDAIVGQKICLRVSIPIENHHKATCLIELGQVRIIHLEAHPQIVERHVSLKFEEAVVALLSRNG